MRPRTTKRYCADPKALGAMKRDGLGWRYGLECGCFHDTMCLKVPDRLARLRSVLKWRK
ncbi:MAG: hypothetical protein ACJAZ1_003295 [Yoonia sp.]|jgi:hypothetical protein